MKFKWFIIRKTGFNVSIKAIIISWNILENFKTIQSTSLSNIQEPSINDTHRQRFIKTIHKFEPDSRTLQKLENDSRFFPEDARGKGQKCASEINLANSNNLPNNRLSKSSSSGSISHFQKQIDSNDLDPQQTSQKDDQYYNFSTLPAKLKNGIHTKNENLEYHSLKSKYDLSCKSDGRNDLAEKRALKMKEVRNKFFGFEDDKVNEDNIDDKNNDDNKKDDAKFTAKGK